MVGTVNGVGTAYYGYRDEQPDGSYITTEFAVFFDIPLWPIRSLRVRPVGSRRVVRRGIFAREKFTSQSYDVAHVPLTAGRFLTSTCSSFASLARPSRCTSTSVTCWTHWIM